MPSKSSGISQEFLVFSNSSAGLADIVSICKTSTSLKSYSELSKDGSDGESFWRFEFLEMTALQNDPAFYWIE